MYTSIPLIRKTVRISDEQCSGEMLGYRMNIVEVRARQIQMFSTEENMRLLTMEKEIALPFLDTSFFLYFGR